MARIGPKQKNMKQTTINKVGQTTRDPEEEKTIKWKVKEKDYQKVQAISEATGELMIDLLVESIRDLSKKYQRKGYIDKDGNPLT